MLKKYFGNKSFYKMAMLIAMPIMLQNGITNAVSLLDNLMVGAVGTVQMTGVSIANTLMFVLYLSIFGAVSGAGIFGAQFFGKGDHDGVRYAFRFKLLVCTGLAAIGAVIFLLFGQSLISLYLKGKGQEQDIAGSLSYGMSYLRIMLLGLAPFVVVQCYVSTLRECGQTVVPMVAGIVAMVVNLFGNWLLIFGNLGMPKLGANGAAIATVASRFVEAAVVVIWTQRHKIKLPFANGLYRQFRIPAKLAGKISVKGLPLVLNETLWAAGMALLSQCYSLRGYDVVAATNITNTICNVFNVSFLAMGSAIGIIVGQMLGAGETERAKDSVRKLTVFSVLICIAFGGLLAAVSKGFPRFYNTTDEIRALATSFILINAILMPMNAYTNAAYFTLRSGGKTLVTMLFDSFFVCVVTAPAAFMLSRYTDAPIVTLYFCCQALDFIKCIIGYFMIRSGIWVQNIVKESTI